MLPYLRPRRDVAVGGDVALGPRKARHHAVVAEHDLIENGIFVHLSPRDPGHFPPRGHFQAAQGP